MLELNQSKHQTITGAMNHRINIDTSGYYTTLNIQGLVYDYTGVASPRGFVLIRRVMTEWAPPPARQR